MKKVKLIIAATLMLLAAGANAAFVDNRTPAAGGEISVAYKAISVEALLGEIVPQGYAIEYMSAEIPGRKIDLNGKGTWEALVVRAAAAAHVKVENLRNEKVVRFSDEGDAKVTHTTGGAPGGEGKGTEKLASGVKDHKNPREQVAPPSVQTWSLQPGHTIGQDLQSWATKAGWKVVWNMSRDWAVPAPTTFAGDFQTAAGKVIETLTTNGALIRAQFYTGNNTMVVTGSGITTQ